MGEGIGTTTRPSQDQGSVAMVQAKAGEMVSQAQETAREQAQRAGIQLRQQLDQRSTQAGEQARDVAQAVRQSAIELREQGKDGPARLVEQAAERVESLASYLSSSDSDRLLRDAEAFARRNPAAVAVGAALLGFMGARFLGASSRRRAQGGGDGSPSRALTPPPRASQGPALTGPSDQVGSDEIVIIEDGPSSAPGLGAGKR
jgi:hypothetical protein